MTSPLAGKTRVRCDVCLRRYFNVNRLAFAKVLRPCAPADGAAALMEFPPGAIVCNRCVAHNAVQRQVNPLPLQKSGRPLTKTHRRKLFPEAASNREADRLRRGARELRSIGDAFVELGRMRATHDRLNVLADELVVMAEAAEIADRIAAEEAAAE